MDTSSRPSSSLSAATAVVGVVGYPVTHSLSPLLHNTAFTELGLDWVSLGFEVDPVGFPDALTGARELGIRGLSVTMPHKSQAFERVDRRTPLAERLQAVNCVTFRADGSVGDNTDGPGLVAALRRRAGFDPAGERCLVVGAGGAGRAVIAALADAGAAEVVVVNRTTGRGEEAASLAGAVGRIGDAGEAAECTLVVDATPVGMAGRDAGEAGWAIAPSLLGPGQVAVDLVYDPPETPWLAAARERGAFTCNGLGMLVHQAALQLATWTGLEAPVEAMWRAATAEPGPP